jgi:quercetin dioxygenase-like cupin family protein
MTITTLEEFTAAELAKSPAEVLERFWAADTVVAEHTHPFDANALIIKGEMWLTCGGQTQHLRPGDRFAVPRGTPHAERYGPEGTTFWVARRGA